MLFRSVAPGKYERGVSSIYSFLRFGYGFYQNILLPLFGVIIITMQSFDQLTNLICCYVFDYNDTLLTAPAYTLFIIK